jgi:flagellar protein FliO/FliZ
MNISTIITLLQTIIVLLIVIYLANLSLKVLNRKIQQQTTMIQIIQKQQVTPGSSIGVVKILDTYYLMSLADKENTILKELEKKDVEAMMTEPGEQKPFQFADMKSAVMQQWKRRNHSD